MKTAGLKGFKIVKMFGVHLSCKQKLFYTGCLIGMLIMVYLSPHIAGHIIPYMGVSENNGTPKSSILIWFSIINHPFWGTTIFGNTHAYTVKTKHVFVHCCPGNVPLMQGMFFWTPEQGR